MGGMFSAMIQRRDNPWIRLRYITSVVVPCRHRLHRLCEQRLEPGAGSQCLPECTLSSKPTIRPSHQSKDHPRLLRILEIPCPALTMLQLVSATMYQLLLHLCQLRSIWKSGTLQVPVRCLQGDHREPYSNSFSMAPCHLCVKRRAPAAGMQC